MRRDGQNTMWLSPLSSLSKDKDIVLTGAEWGLKVFHEPKHNWLIVTKLSQCFCYWEYASICKTSKFCFNCASCFLDVAKMAWPVAPETCYHLPSLVTEIYLVKKLCFLDSFVEAKVV
jgi:hypothetical protein